MKQKNPTPLDNAAHKMESLIGQALRHPTYADSMEKFMGNPDLVELAIAKEPVIRDAISQICRAWIQTGEPMRMQDETFRYFLYRLLYASKVLVWLKSGGCQVPKTETDILHWLLIDS